MQFTVPHPLLSQLSELLSTQMGLYYPEKRLTDLERGIIAATPALGVGSPEACVRQLLSATLTRKQVEILASHLTVGETYFFREKKSFTVLEDHIFPELMRTCAHANRQLRIWSAGCCTGEEPYSIAMLLDRLIGHSEKWNATILATDINPVFLQKAAEGLYSEWSFRETPVWIKERYFKQRKKGQFEILPHIRKRVTFSYLNLAEDAYPSLTNDTHAMDVIFCRNVLMYFSPEWVQKIGQNFHRSLVNGGWLIVSPVESSSSLFSQFKATPFPQAILYQKTKKQESQTSVAEYSATMPDSSPSASCMPAPALTQVSFFQDEKISFSLKHVSTEALSVVTSASVQPQNVQHTGIDPEHHGLDALCRTARSHANLGELTEAIKWCEKAIAANKLNPAAHYLLATIHQELGQGEIAAQSLMRTLYLDPNFVLAHFALGNLCLSQGRHREAERHFDNALALLHAHPHDELPLEAGGLTAGRLTEIITSVRTSLSRSTPEI
ncbi:CheR-type MCP methyltransferase [Nitrosospira sp. Nsp5]|uniref:MCP methyltransferase, CheR-type n=1 Tax=Nitrosospira multiformis TaxID=1231 RepID=A0ABY0TJ68_9PROT|nr:MULTISPECIES: protein-glutamate O-methyltransferase CheR [Nitrosospira]PTR05314.1 CheR-type MCP methyltransferase [Nitrosospira sp. Nsp5]SDQ90974.1 MCP methyltransferase, CheR-type [Nitrosospira multiformis]